MFTEGHPSHCFLSPPQLSKKSFNLACSIASSCNSFPFDSPNVYQMHSYLPIPLPLSSLPLPTPHSCLEEKQPAHTTQTEISQKKIQLRRMKRQDRVHSISLDPWKMLTLETDWDLPTWTEKATFGTSCGRKAKAGFEICSDTEMVYEKPKCHSLLAPSGPLTDNAVPVKCRPA